jgi:hypothetical protein
MTTTIPQQPDAKAEGLRERNVGKDVNVGAQQAAGTEAEEEVEKGKKTFGRTPDGTGEHTIFLGQIFDRNNAKAPGLCLGKLLTFASLQGTCDP